jgi:hypothetical protein
LQPAQAPPIPEEADAQATAQSLKDIHDHLQAEILRAQHRYQESADRRRSPAPAFKEGDKVWLNAKNIVTRRPSRKLDHRRLGPFTISKVISHWVFRLELPASIRIHPVQHVSLLDPAHDDPLPGQRIPPPPPVEVEGEEEWLVDEILDSRIRRRRLQYLVQWTGYEQPDWQPAENVNELEAVDTFHRRYPDKPGPLPLDN